MNTISNPTRAAIRAVSASYTPGIKIVSDAVSCRIVSAPVTGLDVTARP
jgi:hypothetical protein